MSARAMWKGVVRFGEHEVLFKLYAAAQDARVRFRMIDRDSGQPIHQKMVDPASGEAVEQTQRGYELEPGRFVLLGDEELASLDPDADRTVEVAAVLPAASIDPARYDRPYWLAPDGSAEAYGALAKALSDADRVAVVRWAMRKRRYVGALRSERGRLGLCTLRRAGEIVDPKVIEPPRAEIDDKERKLAEQLVEALEDEFDVSEYRATYRDRVAELLEKKARGEEVEAKALEAPPEAPSNLEAALRESLEAAKQARRAKGGSKREGEARTEEPA